MRSFFNGRKGPTLTNSTSKTEPDNSNAMAALKANDSSIEQTANSGAAPLPLKGWQTELQQVPFLDLISDNMLIELNKILDWKCFIADSQGRRFGKATSPIKRHNPQVIPDYRLKILQDRVSLAELHILEVGCFEGIHTIGLARASKSVKAIDSRIENVVKTMVRLGFFDLHASVFTLDLEKITPQHYPLLSCDLIHHVGVLYHLTNPAEHILQFANYCEKHVLLDTHYATPEMAKLNYSHDGKEYRFYRHRESGYKDVFSGMLDHAKWLTLEDIEDLLTQAGFGKVEIIEKRSERNGPRVLLFASR